MQGSALLPLQQRILTVLAGVSPRWTLTGGAALAGFHLGHRTTRDLDLFWHGHRTLPDPDAVVVRLQEAGLGVEVLRRAPTFVQLRVAEGDEVMVVDLVADPVPVVETPVDMEIGDTAILVDTAHEILVNKLCALLSRSALRDLVDVLALVDAGGDLGRAVRDASSKDGGFSPATLAWVLEGMPLSAMARASGVADTSALEMRCGALILTLAGLARPPR